MNKFSLIFTILFLCTYSASTSQKHYLVEEQEVIVSGKIVNYQRSTSPLTILLQQPNFLGSSIKHIEKIDEEGNFTFRIKANSIQECNLVYTEFLYLLISPGSNVYLELDDQKIEHPDLFNEKDERQNKRKSQDDFYKFQNDELGRSNHHINQYMKKLPIPNYSHDFANNAVKNSDPNQYINHINERQDSYQNFYQRFKKENETTKLFNAWAIDHLKYSAWSDLLRYNWLYPMYNKIEKKDFNLPYSYFDFFSEYDMNDVAIFSFSHNTFLHELFMFTGHYKNGSISFIFQKYIEANINNDPKKALEFLELKIDKRIHGFTKELFITRYYALFLEWQFIEKFEASYDSSYTNDPYLKSAIRNKYAETKKYLSNKNVEKYNINSIKSDVTDKLIDSISQKYKGKVVYIDFWAPWCGPCMAEIPNMKDLQAEFNPEEVVFLFLANRCKADSWQATIVNKDIKGEHILLSDNQFNILAKNLGIGGIPHYTLIDREGNIVSKNAPRPSEKNRIVKEINALLQQK